ncbi:hypothetical protein NE236_04220 [Actinoallomurus purpureus]|uniref:hypothetical protein n=1 Tax=Actinoallomurus purpureus TaxID=478114 RepID=UPI0020937978|nr:hypothetical protein [Actinoallomurus purpureus]MCO6004176.1 hypothetical protein [Actinoallomurus purpureus]
MIVIIVVIGLVVLVLGAFGLFGLVGGVRDRKPGVVVGGVIFLLAALGCGWIISLLVSVDHDLTSHVDRARAVNCVVEIIGGGREIARINDTHVYRFRVRVRIPGEAPYVSDSTGAVSSLSGGIGVGRTGYACLADRDHPKKVEILWDQPMP